MTTKQAPQRNTSGFTLIELLVVIVIIGVLFSFSFPALKNSLAKAKAAKCVVQLRQCGGALIFSAVENGNRLKLHRGGEASFHLKPYFVITQGSKDTSYTRCPIGNHGPSRAFSMFGVNFGNTPSVRAEWTTEEVVNEEDGRESRVSTLNIPVITDSTKVILMGDSCNSNNIQTFKINKAGGEIALWHDDRANAVFLDGSARSLSLKDMGEFEIKSAYVFNDGPSNGGTLVSVPEYVPE